MQFCLNTFVEPRITSVVAFAVQKLLLSPIKCIINTYTENKYAHIHTQVLYKYSFIILMAKSQRNGYKQLLLLLLYSIYCQWLTPAFVVFWFSFVSQRTFHFYFALDFVNFVLLLHVFVLITHPPTQRQIDIQGGHLMWQIFKSVLFPLISTYSFVKFI